MLNILVLQVVTQILTVAEAIHVQVMDLKLIKVVLKQSHFMMTVLQTLNLQLAAVQGKVGNILVLQQVLWQKGLGLVNLQMLTVILV